MTPDQSTPAAASGDEIEARLRTEWDRVEEQHEKVVGALNDTPVALTIRSAGGLAMFRGLSDTSSNGHVHDLLEEGHLASVEQALGESPGEDGAGQDQPAGPGSHSPAT